MTSYADFREDRFDLPGIVYQEGGALDAQEFLSKETFLFQHAIGSGRLALHIAQQRKRKVVLFLESRLDRRRVGADAHHRRSQFLKVGESIAEPARLRDSTRSVGLGEKEQDDRVSLKILEADGTALLIRQLESWCWLSDLQHDYL